ncbi:MAG TPA: hypothetical protein VK589_16875 [Chryseolinea sp.]|nr:hypothetical protein [Chryseolinea sp.]
MHKSAWHSIAFTFLLLSSCGRSLPDIEGLDGTTWKNDKNGCTGERSKMKDAVVSQKDKLLALSELDIVDLLGKPDQQELYKRNQKFYYYFIEPSKECNLPSGEASLRLVIRFNAMGLAKEIVTEE